MLPSFATAFLNLHRPSEVSSLARALFQILVGGFLRGLKPSPASNRAFGARQAEAPFIPAAFAA